MWAQAVDQGLLLSLSGPKYNRIWEGQEKTWSKMVSLVLFNPTVSLLWVCSKTHLLFAVSNNTNSQKKFPQTWITKI